jgi:hypothetical protein
LGLLGAEVVHDPDLDGVSLDAGPVLGGGAWHDHASEWAASGAMALTGEAGGAPLVARGEPAGVAAGVAHAFDAVCSSTGALSAVGLDGAALLGERAAIAGLRRAGSCSPGGSCRIVRADPGWLVVNLARESDLELLPAWLEAPVAEDPWAVVSERVAHGSAEDLVERAAMMGLAVAMVGEGETDDQLRALGQGLPPEPWRILGPSGTTRQGSTRPGLVVDLSVLWAGPLCANLLGLAGFTVVKVESSTRPDGARLGPPEFYDLLHGGHRSVVVDFDDAADRGRLLELMSTADVVIESSRPRALDQIGLGPEGVLSRSPETVWVSITGYGRTGPWSNRIAFGDDAAAAAGLIAVDAGGAPLFCGDAIADPLTGLHAALAVVAMWSSATGGLVDLSLRDVAGSCRVAGPGGARRSRPARAVGDAWVLDTADGEVAVASPRARGVGEAAPASGADTGALLAWASSSMRSTW